MVAEAGCRAEVWSPNKPDDDRDWRWIAGCIMYGTWSVHGTCFDLCIQRLHIRSFSEAWVYKLTRGLSDIVMIDYTGS